MSDSGPDPRPRYGEYATPEEQRARIRQPESTPAPPASAPPAPAPAADVPARAGTTRRIDRIVTIGLLAYGFFTVVTAFPSLLDHAAYTSTLFSMLGVDAQLTDPAGARPWGIAAALVLATGWFVTAWASWQSIRAGRLSFWIPIVGGLVFNVLSSILMLVPIMNDPVVWPALQSAILGG